MEKIVQELDLNYSGFDAGITHSITQWEKLESATKQAAGQNPFKKQADDLLKFNNQLRSGGDLFKKIEASPKALKNEINRLAAELLKYITLQDKAAKSGNWKQTQEDIKRTRSELDALNKKYAETVAQQDKVSSGGGKSGGSFGSSLLSGAGGLLAGLGIATGAAEIIAGIVSIRAQTETLGKQLEISLGSSSAGAAALRLIQSFADKTPHAIGDVTSAFNRLVGVGIIPTEKQLFQLSDIATANGKSIQDYVELIADAQQGSFERLAEFGLKASKSGDKVTFTFKGQQTTVQNTTEAINDYLLSLGSLPGIEGQTAEAGKLLAGRYSTLLDTFRGIGNELGVILQPAMEKLLDVTQRAATGLSGYLKDLRKVASEREKTGQSGVGAFFQSIFNPRQFNIEATEAEFRAYEDKIEDAYRSGDYREGTDTGDGLDAQRKAQLIKNKEAEALRIANAAKLKAEKDSEKARTKQEQIDRDILRAKADQLTGIKKLEDDLQKLEEKYQEERIQNLDKNSADYLDALRKVTLREIDARRQAAIKQGQEETGTKFYNRRLDRIETEPNLNYRLPDYIESMFSQLEDKANTEFQVSEFEAADARAREQFERQQFLEKSTIARQNNELELELRRQVLKAESELVREAGESEIDYEARKNKALLLLRVEYYEKLLKLAESDPTQQDQIIGLRETIAEARKSIDDIDKKGKEGPQNLFQLLGLTFKDKEGKDITAQVEKQVNEATELAVNAANQILSQQLQADQARIDSIDRQIESKQREVDVELELSRQGLANNLTVKRQEEALLQQERKKAIDAQRRDQAIQLSINAALQASELTLAVAKLIKTGATLGPIGIIASGISIAAMIALFTNSISQIANLPKYHTGDEVTHETARKRRMGGNKRADEVDARLQVGEGVIQKKSYQANKRLFRYLNTLDHPIDLHDFAAYVRANPFEMVDGRREQGLRQINQYYEMKAESSRPDRELHSRVDGLASRLDTLIDETRSGRKAGRVMLADGRVEETDAAGNVTVWRS